MPRAFRLLPTLPVFFAFAVTAPATCSRTLRPSAPPATSPTSTEQGRTSLDESFSMLTIQTPVRVLS